MQSEPIGQKEELSTEKIIDKLGEGLVESGWYAYLRLWFLSAEFRHIINTLKDKSDTGDRWVPKASRIFRFLQTCPYESVKVVILVDEACCVMDVHSGIPMSVEPKMNKYGRPIINKPSWIAEDMLKSLGIPWDERDYDMTLWTSQGVLILPVSPTCKMLGKPHRKLWAPLIPRLIEIINQKSNIPWLLIGEEAWEYEDHIKSRHVRKMVKRPFVDNTWHKDVNDILEKKKQKPINWMVSHKKPLEGVEVKNNFRVPAPKKTG